MEATTTVTKGNENVSTLVVDEASGSSADDIVYVSSRIVFAVILAGGLIANCALVVNIFRGQRRLGSRAPPQLNLFIVALHATANIINCLANGIWIIYTAAVGRNADPYSTLGSGFDAAAVQMIAIVHGLGLALMSVDRLLAVRSAVFDQEQRGMTLLRSALLIGLAWLFSIGVSLPLVVPNGVDIEGNSQRYLSTMDSEAAPAYVWTTMMIGYVCPIGVVVGMFIATGMSASHHRRKLAASRAYTSSAGPAGETTGPPETDRHRRDPAATLLIEVNAAKYVGCLFAAWCVLVLPFPVLSLVRIGRTAVMPSKLRPFSYAKDIDAIVTWLFVSYPILLPAITFIWRRNVCCRCAHRASACCRNGLTAPDGDHSPSISPKRRQRVGDVDPLCIGAGRPGGFESTVGNRPVPVLFATPHGLHVRSSSSPNGLSDLGAQAAGQIDDGKSADAARKCDVFGSVYALQNGNDDGDFLNTSDYDSGDDDGGAGDSTRTASRLLEKAMAAEDRTPPSTTPTQEADRPAAAGSVAPGTSKTANRPRSEKANCVSCGIGGEKRASRSTWYDAVDDGQETRTESKHDRLVDSGVGTLKKSSNTTAEGLAETTEMSLRGGVNGQDPDPLAKVVSAPAVFEPVQAEATAKPKKKDGRSSRKIADVTLPSDAGRKETANDRPKSRSSEPRNRRRQHSSSPSAVAKPRHRDLPKIVINGEHDAENETGDQTAGSGAPDRHNADPNACLPPTDARKRAGKSSDGHGQQNEEGTRPNSKPADAGSSAQHPAKRPLPPVSKRRRAASESSATTILSDPSPNTS